MLFYIPSKVKQESYYLLTSDKILAKKHIFSKDTTLKTLYTLLKLFMVSPWGVMS